MRKTDEEIKRISIENAEKCLSSEIELLKKLASIDSGTQNLEGNLKTVEIIEEELKKIKGIQIRRYEMPKYGIDICAKLPCENAKEKIILNAHTDTVFASGVAKDNPFHIEGDRIFGLGVGDCKGGIAVAINAVRIAQENGLLPDDKEFVFMFNCDEEKGIEAGYRFFDSELPADRAYVFESAGKEMTITTERKVQIFFTVDVTGIRSHSGNAYTSGRSAVVEIAHRIQRLYENNDPENEIYFNFGPVESEDPMNVLSGHAKVRVSTRIKNKKGFEKANEIVSRVMAEPPYLDGTVTTFKCNEKILRFLEREEKNLKLYREISAASESLGYGKLGEHTSGGFGDVCYFNSMGCAAVDGLGPLSADIHNTNESISIRSLKERTALFVSVIANMN